MRVLTLAAWALAAGATGCSPALDWREFQPEGSGVLVTFPCKPDRHARSVTVGARTLQMEMLVCSAAGTTFALSFADLSDPADVTLALADLQTLAIANIGAAIRRTAALQVPGMTPNAQALRLSIEGRRPDGAAVTEELAFFTRGLRIYQATLLGEQVPVEAADTFIGAFKLPS